MASDKVAFKLPAQCFSRSGNVKARRPKCFTVTPLCVEFERLLKQKKPESIIPVVSCHELLNIVVALYDVCLPDIGLEDLRANICARGAKTFILIRDEQEILEEYHQKVSADIQKDPISSSVEQPTTEEDERERPGMCSFVFSDSESSAEEDESETESESEEKERFNASLKEFLACVRKRALQRRQLQDANTTSSPLDIGIESRIVAAMTYQRSTLNSKEKVIKLSLLSTRKRYRGYGVGQYIVKLLQDPSLVGLYDAIVTHADSGAVKFFTRCGFSDDILLNSKFKEFEDDWTNTTMMCYFPPFTKDSHCSLDATDIELDMELWKMRSLVAYQAQTVFMTRIIHEIRTSRKQLASQKEQIRSLTNELERTKDEKYQLEKRFLQFKLERAHQLCQSTNFKKELLLFDDEFEFTATLPYSQYKKKESEQIDDQDDQESIINQLNLEFIEKMQRCPGMEDNQIEVKELVQASLSIDVKRSIESHVSTLIEPTLCTRLYYCGGQDHPERLTQILGSGFTHKDLHRGAYGKGLYFSSSASTACTFSPPRQVLIADVHIGNTETVLHKDEDRTCASKGFDSILVPGRLHESSSPHTSDLMQEFIVFNNLQASPVCLLTYCIGRNKNTEGCKDVTSDIVK
ncbi:uncharacterized protein [Pleurodeles waltl]|uniref:uncharacterized protein isoform X2 n=1 Tax=Pleurodeles waltl TaxID=8319 RepID=UPI003709C235